MKQISQQRKLVVFDVEGVLLPKNRYLVFEMGRNLSFSRFAKLLFLGFLYETRILSLESALRRIYRLFQGFRVEELLEVFEKVPLFPHTEEVFTKLRERGLKVALISSGLPQVMVENLASRLEADYAVGLELVTNNGVLTGEIRGNVVKENGKTIVLEKILSQEGLTKGDCMVVADDRNNAPIFYPEALKIGYNPDSLIAFKSDHVTGNLLEIVSILEEGESKRRRFLLRNEVVREIIHASGFLAALVALYFGALQTALLLSLTALVYTASELARVERKDIPIVSSITLNAATFTERYEFATAPIFLALGVMLSLLLFPTPINYASIAIVCLGDSTASIFGKLLGKNPIPFNKGKNLEGSVAGLVFAFLGAAFFLNPQQALVGAIIGMFVESLPLPVSDNLSTPLLTGALLTLLG